MHCYIDRAIVSASSSHQLLLSCCRSPRNPYVPLAVLGSCMVQMGLPESVRTVRKAVTGS